MSSDFNLSELASKFIPNAKNSILIGVSIFASYFFREWTGNLTLSVAVFFLVSGTCYYILQLFSFLLSGFKQNYALRVEKAEQEGLAERKRQKSRENWEQSFKTYVSTRLENELDHLHGLYPDGNWQASNRLYGQRSRSREAHNKKLNLNRDLIKRGLVTVKETKPDNQMFLVMEPRLKDRVRA